MIIPSLRAGVAEVGLQPRSDGTTSRAGKRIMGMAFIPGGERCPKAPVKVGRVSGWCQRGVDMDRVKLYRFTTRPGGQGVSGLAARAQKIAPHDDWTGKLARKRAYDARYHAK